MQQESKVVHELLHLLDRRSYRHDLPTDVSSANTKVLGEHAYISLPLSTFFDLLDWTSLAKSLRVSKAGLEAKNSVFSLDLQMRSKE